MANNSPEFSFDLYPDLDRDLDDIYRRNLEQGVASGEVIATAVLAATVDRQLENDPHEISKLAEDWARLEFDGESGINQKWGRYYDQYNTDNDGMNHSPIDPEPNLSFDNLKRHDWEISNFEQKIEKLYLAKRALLESGETTPEGINVGETMHLVAVPWRIMRHNLVDGFDSWVKLMRHHQGIKEPDYINDELLSCIKSDSNRKLYKNPLKIGEYLTAKEYLDQKIAEDGNWGIILAQTSNEAGIKSLVKGSPEGRTPDALTQNGSGLFYIGEQAIYGLGIFEWLALTFQEDPRQLSTKDVSWLLANRLIDNGVPRVPCGDWYDSQVGSGLFSPGVGDVGARPRLAVIALNP